MWSKFDGKPYSRAEFKAMVKAIPDKDLKWCKFMVLHHAAAPSIAHWMSGYPVAQRIRNMQDYYENKMGWRSGPHSFIPPSKEICHWGFTPFTEKGVHASCFNSTSIGLEMVGNFTIGCEPFHEGLGAVVRDNTIFVLAVLHRQMGLRPDGFVLGKSGLHFHTDCKRDGKICPGAQVTKEWMVQAVLDEMERQEREETPPAPAAVPVAVASSFVIPAADGPAGYDPSAVAPSSNAVAVAAKSKSVWAIVGSLVMTAVSKASDAINVIIDSFGAIVNETKEQIDGLELVAGWLRLNWVEMVVWVSVICLVVAGVRHIALKKVATS